MLRCPNIYSINVKCHFEIYHIIATVSNSPVILWKIFITLYLVKLISQMYVQIDKKIIVNNLMIYINFSMSRYIYIICNFWVNNRDIKIDKFKYELTKITKSPHLLRWSFPALHNPSVFPAGLVFFMETYVSFLSVVFRSKILC